MPIEHNITVTSEPGDVDAMRDLLDGLLRGPKFDTVSDMRASERPSLAIGEIWEAQGFRYKVAASGAADHHLTTAGGVKLYVVTGERGYNIKAFGALGNGVADDTAAIQAAVDAAQAGVGEIHAPAGNYLASGITYDGSKPLKLTGDGEGAFDNADIVQAATLFSLTAIDGRLFQRVTGGSWSNKLFAGFSCINVSGGIGETAFYSENGTFTNFSKVTISGFKYGIRHQKTVYAHIERVQVRGALTAFDFSNITETAPLALNSQTGFFNNVVHFDNCVAQKGDGPLSIGFHVAGASIKLSCCSAESMNLNAVKIAGTDFNASTVDIDALYVENCPDTCVDVRNAALNMGVMFYGTNTSAFAVKAVASRVRIGYIRAYAAMTVGVSAASGSVVEMNDIYGAVTTPMQVFDTARIRIKDREQAAPVDFNLGQAQTLDITLNSQAGIQVMVDIIVTENGGPKRTVQLIADANNLYLPNTMPDRLGAALFVNGNGNYDLRLTNTATFGWSLVGKVFVSALRYTKAPRFS